MVPQTTLRVATKDNIPTPVNMGRAAFRFDAVAPSSPPPHESGTSQSASTTISASGAAWLQRASVVQPKRRYIVAEQAYNRDVGGCTESVFWELMLPSEGEAGISEVDKRR